MHNERGGFELEEIQRQEYAGNDCVISSGFVVNPSPACDTVYLRLEKEGHLDVELHLRPDEAAAIAWVLAGALWSNEMERLEKAVE